MVVVSDELLGLDATGQAELVSRREVTAVELVDAAAARLAEVNPALNAVIHPTVDRARRAAAGPLPEGPFAGVPFLIKDLIAHEADEPFHEGIGGLAERGFREDRDTRLVELFGAAGLVSIGRTNTSELGLLPTTEPLVYGPTRNPWDLSRSPLGSGGGSAAAVAAGVVPLAHSNDGGGSIRLPASACGLIGLKPTRGRVSLAPVYGDLISGTVSEFAITRSVRDTAALLAAVSAPQVGEPYAPFRAPRDPGSPLRVGVMRSTPRNEHPVHPACRTALDITAAALGELGCVVEESHPAALDDAGFPSEAAKIMPFAFAAFAMSWWERRTGVSFAADEVEPWTWVCAERGRKLSAVDYLSAVEYVQAWTRRLSWWWQDGYDLLLTPTLGEPPPPLGSFAAPNTGLRSAQIVSFTYAFNLSGHPAISLPCHRDDGLPIGVQLIAAHGHEHLLLQISADLEQAMTWTTKTLPVDPDLPETREAAKGQPQNRPPSNATETPLNSETPLPGA
jgi:amidase